MIPIQGLFQRITPAVINLFANRVTDVTFIQNQKDRSSGYSFMFDGKQYMFMHGDHWSAKWAKCGPVNCLGNMLPTILMDVLTSLKSKKMSTDLFNRLGYQFICYLVWIEYMDEKELQQYLDKTQQRLPDNSLQPIAFDIFGEPNDVESYLRANSSSPEYWLDKMAGKETS